MERGIYVINESNVHLNDVAESVEELVSSLSALICDAKDNISDVLSSEQFGTALAVLDGVSSSLSDAISFIGMLRKTASIPTKLFMIKFERYAKGLVAIPYNKRQKYLKKVGKPGLNKDSVFILNVLNKVEELSKIDILLSLLEAKMDEIIDDASYRRLMIMVDKTMYSDLLYLKNNIKHGYFKIKGIEEEALLSTGFILFAGIGVGREEDAGNLYQYTAVAKQLCKIVFGVNDIPKSNNSMGIFAMVTD